MDNKKWYIRTIMAEGVQTAVMQLTEAEAKAVRKFLDNNAFMVQNECWCGCCTISKGYDTKEQAIAHAR